MIFLCTFRSLHCKQCTVYSSFDCVQLEIIVKILFFIYCFLVNILFLFRVFVKNKIAFWIRLSVETFDHSQYLYRNWMRALSPCRNCAPPLKAACKRYGEGGGVLYRPPSPFQRERGDLGPPIIIQHRLRKAQSFSSISTFLFSTSCQLQIVRVNIELECW